jgi:hypothetical protein
MVNKTPFDAAALKHNIIMSGVLRLGTAIRGLKIYRLIEWSMINYPTRREYREISRVAEILWEKGENYGRKDLVEVQWLWLPYSAGCW